MVLDQVIQRHKADGIVPEYRYAFLGDNVGRASGVAAWRGRSEPLRIIVMGEPGC